MTRKHSHKILIVEDNADLAEIYKTKLEMLGYHCTVAGNGVVALYLIQKKAPDLVLLDLLVPDIPGDQILEILRHSSWGKKVKVLIISNITESEASPNLRQLGIIDFIVKADLNLDDIGQIVDNAINSQ